MAISPQVTGGITLSYTEDSPGYRRVVERVDNFDLLVRRLHDIQASRRSNLFLGVNLEDNSENELAIGLADEKWCLLYSDPQHTQLIYSLGDQSAEGDVELRFEQWEVLPRKCFLPVEKALDVIRTWFTTGELSKEIAWERQSLLPDSV